MKCCMLCYGNNGMLWVFDEWEFNDICCKILILWYYILMFFNVFVWDLNFMFSYILLKIWLNWLYMYSCYFYCYVYIVISDLFIVNL